MSQPAPSLIDRTRKWLRHLKQRSRSPLIRPDEKTGSFSNAHDFTINGAQIIDASDAKDIKINYINTVVSGRQAVFELLEPYTCLDAIKDSSARHPPPKCHPETRLKIRERLMRWLLNEYQEWKMMWVRGAAGTGKSAVAQSFGDSCGEEKKYGASYFFSRTAGRNKIETVVPTIVFQLATTIPEYRSLIAHQLADNPVLLRKSPPVQFRELIIEPFVTLQRQCPRKPIIIILDGLDECEGEDAQREILEMITNAIHSNPDLPLCWLIFSRPEAHLKNAFSRNLVCGREELIIDDECRENVERYVKDRLVDMKGTYKDIAPLDWPSQNQLQELLDAVSGLFIFASTCLNYINDPEEADPPSQLDSLLTFMSRSQDVVSRNPLAVLDLLYSRILERIPPTAYGTTRRILAYMAHRDKLDQDERLESAQALANFLRLDQRAFYKAVRGLHSVMSIPESEDASESRLQFYHASFQDFLLDPNRSGKFVIVGEEVLVDILQLSIYWYDVDVTLFHTSDGWNFDYQHEHDCLPGLTWVTENTRSQVSQSITRFFEDGVLNEAFCQQWGYVHQSFFSQLSSIDFRYWSAPDIFYLALLCRLDLSTSLVRVEPSSPTDHQLLEYIYLVMGNDVAKPAIFPLRPDLPDGRWTREYFFIGNGVRAVIVWRTKSPTSRLEHLFSLCCDQEPSETQISEYKKYLEKIEWDEEKARLEME